MSEGNILRDGDLEYLRKAIHDLNNRVGVILTSAELLQLDAPDGVEKSRSEVIERKALEARKILAEVARHYFD